MTGEQDAHTGVASTRYSEGTGLQVGLLTGGDDLSYALGLTSALVKLGVSVDFVGNDESDVPALRQMPLVRFLNLRGDQSHDANLFRKIIRLSVYYARLIKYAAVSEPRIFHILWNNKFQFFDRTLLMLYYRLLRRKIVLTAHNVNAAKRDGSDSAINRFSLGVQYRLAHHIFVHTEKMKGELRDDFAVLEQKVSVIPFGINDVVPKTELTTEEAKRRLGILAGELTALFFGHIAPYKGVDYLVAAVLALSGDVRRTFRLFIAGQVKIGSEDYWHNIERILADADVSRRVTCKIQHIPEEEVEIYFKAADVAVMPYTNIFQSGVLFLAYSFGLPVIATDVGSFRDDVIDGVNGLVCRARDATNLARAIERYFSSDMYRHLPQTRLTVRKLASERHSWARVGEITESVYRGLVCD